jgi:hypothetical protein
MLYKQLTKMKKREKLMNPYQRLKCYFHFFFPNTFSSTKQFKQKEKEKKRERERERAYKANPPR